MLQIVSKILTLPSSPALSTPSKQVHGQGICLSQWLNPRAQLWMLMRVAKVGQPDQTLVPRAQESSLLWGEVAPCWKGALSIEPLPLPAFELCSYFLPSFNKKKMIGVYYNWEECFFSYLSSLGYTKYVRFEAFGSWSSSETRIDSWNYLLVNVCFCCSVPLLKHMLFNGFVSTVCF